MREIKFRGLTTSFYQKPPEKEWVYGGLQISYDGLTRIIPLDPAGPWDGVDPETVGQFTGLKDPNGVEIYEGDVVSCNTFRGVVKYGSYTASFQAVSAGWWPIGLEYDKHDPFEVIGNIFDNPELDKQFGEVYRKEQ